MNAQEARKITNEAVMNDPFVSQKMDYILKLIESAARNRKSKTSYTIWCWNDDFHRMISYRKKTGWFSSPERIPSNDLSAIMSGLSKMGYSVQFTDDGLDISW